MEDFLVEHVFTCEPIAAGLSNVVRIASTANHVGDEDEMAERAGI
jgi:hypothetical protein